MIRNGDAEEPGTTAARKPPATCEDCGALFNRHAAAKRCKPCSSAHQEREQARRSKERRATKRGDEAQNGK